MTYRGVLIAGLGLTCCLSGPSFAQHEGHGAPMPTPIPSKSPAPRATPAPGSRPSEPASPGHYPAPAPMPTPGGSRAEPLTQSNLAPQPGWPSPVMDHAAYSLLLIDQFEYVPYENSLYWDMVGWWGGDYNRVWVKSEGSAGAAGSVGDLEFQALYGRLVTSYFDAQVGLRLDRVWRPGSGSSRAHAVLGFQGLAPLMYEVEPVLFVSQSGDVSGRLTLTRSLVVTQHTLLQFKLETDAALQPVPAFGVGAGWNDLSLGLRLRHEFRREFAPYVGVNWTQRFGQTAEFARQAGDTSGQLSLVAGIRFWF